MQTRKGSQVAIDFPDPFLSITWWRTDRFRHVSVHAGLALTISMCSDFSARVDVRNTEAILIRLLAFKELDKKWFEKREFIPIIICHSHTES